MDGTARAAGRLFQVCRAAPSSRVLGRRALKTEDVQRGWCRLQGLHVQDRGRWSGYAERH
jgi:hypothetical protein